MRKPRLLVFALLTVLSAAAVSCSTDYNPDDSFVWGAIGAATTHQVEAKAWIGGGMDGWKSGNAPSAGSSAREFSDPTSVAVDLQGNLYVADTTNHRICRWNYDGWFTGWIGGGQDGWQSGSAPASSDVYNAFNTPSCVAIDYQGRILVADSGNNRVCRWSADGVAEGWIGNGEGGWTQSSGAGSPGTEAARFNNPNGVCADSSGNVYVADTYNHRISKWSEAGSALGWTGQQSFSWQMGQASGTGSLAFGSFDNPSGVFVNPMGDIFVADSANNRIARLAPDGSMTGWLGDGTDGWKTHDGGHPGNGLRDFSAPTSVAVDWSGMIWVADTLNHRISKWDPSGIAKGWFGGGSPGFKTANGAAGAGDYQSFSFPTGVALGGNGFIYLADRNNARICKWKALTSFTQDSQPPGQVLNFNAIPGAAHGSVELSWSAPGDDGDFGQASMYILKYADYPLNDTNFADAWEWPQTWKPKWGSAMETYTVFNLNISVTYYFALRALDEVCNCSPVSNFVSSMPTNHGLTAGLAQGWIGDRRSGWNTVNGASNYPAFDGFSSTQGVATDSTGNIYVADVYNHRVSKWDQNGIPRGWIGGGLAGWQKTPAPSNGVGFDYFYSPSAVFVDESSGFIYVSDSGNNRVSRWTLNGYADGWIGGGLSGWQYGNALSWGNGDGYFNWPLGIWVTSTRIYVADSNNNRISRWNPDGTNPYWIGGGSGGWKTGTAPSWGSGQMEFYSPSGVCLDSGGNIYVADTYNHRVSVWNDMMGTSLGWLGGGVNGLNIGAAPSSGSGDYMAFNSPFGIWQEGSSIYVSDMNNHRVSKWSIPSASAIGWIGGGSDSWQTSNGAGSGQNFMNFNYPRGLCVRNGMIYVGDESNARVTRWID